MSVTFMLGKNNLKEDGNSDVTLKTTFVNCLQRRMYSCKLVHEFFGYGLNKEHSWNTYFETALGGQGCRILSLEIV